ncbi:hypothetical protein BDP27DRAFT_1224647 [Rhodocollybia butyracea]|uniref:Uncharacterized protein n=1 Tax=Rhodocollybia butyracea TaxID=206335 RepID=A0A9P5U6Y9_9AGAR|nr:hypothetical protein BDP27DRAFT_1224647 [Rhodocollybia butyracea]
MESEAPAASTAYVGLLDQGDEGEGRTWALKELVGPNSKGFTLIKAVPQCPSTTVPLVDANHRVMGLIAYGDSTMAQCAEEAAELMRELRPEACFTGKGIDNRRGHFGNLNAGVAHGGGRLHPANITNTETNAEVIDKLINSTPFQRLSGYATGIFKTWAPRLYEYCSLQYERLLSSDDSFIRIFDNSVMASAAFNFGPRTVCIPHIDFGNLAFLWCWIWGLGWFNWKRGGHLVLWDLRLVIEFPPGTVAAIPSGVCRHGNTRIGKKETRYSFTQYSSGGNFRWVDHGFQTEEKYHASLTAREAEEEQVRKEGRWKMGLNLFSTLEELGLDT